VTGGRVDEPGRHIFFEGKRCAPMFLPKPQKKGLGERFNLDEFAACRVCFFLQKNTPLLNVWVGHPG
jgi:hypothetical protein